MQVWEPYALGETSTVRAGAIELALAGAAGAEVREVADGVWLIDAPDATAAQWRVPCVGVSAFWTPIGGARWVPPIWNAPLTARLTAGAPVVSLVGAAGANVCTVGVAEPVAPVSFTGGVIEETGEFAFTLHGDGLRFRLDLSERPFSAAVAGTAAWWQAEAGDLPPTPDRARLPVYSTWYSMHQEVGAESVELQARLAKELGCETIIVDDGWQTADRARGYAFCGDWEPNTTTFPDMSGHVARVRELGMAYMLWYALPFVGKHNAAFERFEGRCLRYLDHMDAAVLDPRHPEVREFLIDRLAQAVEAWGMDGLKIDFVDRFATPGGDPAPADGADCAEVDEGVRRLLRDLDARLRRVRPELLVEHRQPYTSPGLWPYANMVRATDCPLSPQENRQRTVDLRLAAGPVAVHSDMLLWHPDEPAEQVAVHLINVLFSVPQISVDLAAQRPDQLDTLRFWLGVFRDHLETLQLGTLEPEQPEHGYPLVRARDERATIVARYAPLPVEVPESGDLLVANAATDPRVVLFGAGPARVEVRDCRGSLVRTAELSPEPGASVVEVPTGGLLTLRRD
ncbi:glycoside hydrolase family 36 protein [Nonomuraea rhodomycinica]|uniref:Alpha-galactosidase n=1 Tax=Nonomuraea rhodomycinica TaxID=1712872 RepID=A0A7Y6IWC3_9ACTN|nr:glycoside hydrolase family 36 protein [Nonomuraea rhodomycinica]NUW45038.1 alpha-galactosidase [Nonomuraea rhodomycinica]